MTGYQSTFVSPKTPIIDVIQIIDSSALQIALVVDEERKLLGTVTDGDIRRAILRKISLEEAVEKIMFSSPIVASTDSNSETILSLMQQKEVKQIPILDRMGHVVDLKLLMDFAPKKSRENMVVLMAGGLGKRLRPLTDDCPKPLLQIGKKPILEILLERLIHSGFSKFCISVNYKAQMIERHFEDGSKWGVHIDYIKEEKRLGTAGALRLFAAWPSKPLLVINADLLTNVSFERILEFHSESKVKATIAVREYDFQIPYGVVHVVDNSFRGIDEKPLHRFFVNAGIYVLEPELIEFIPENEFFDMTDLFELLVGKGIKSAVFPIREYWLDIGKIDDFIKANGDISEIFDDPK